MQSGPSVWEDTNDGRAVADAGVRVADAEHTDIDVVVAGGGITGLTTALLLAREGVRVSVLERLTIGAGTTGRTTAKVSALQGTIYAELLSRSGPDRARQYADANVAGVQLVRELAHSLAPDCDAMDMPAVSFCFSDRTHTSLSEEVDAARQLGLAVRLEDSAGLPFPTAGAAVLDGQLQFHPLRYINGLAREIERLGSTVREHCAVVGADDHDDHVVVHTTDGDVRARWLVVATLLPFVDIGGFFAKTEPMRSYALAATLHEPLPAGMYLSIDEPVRSLRPLTLDGEPAVVAGGPSHKTGTEAATDEYHDELDAWLHQNLPVKAVTNRWSAQDYVSSDRIPYVGRCPRTDSIFVATAFRKWGLSNGSAAAMMIRDLLLDRDNPWLTAFDATRGLAVKDVVRVGKVNLDDAKQALRGLLDRTHKSDVHDLPIGRGAVVEVDDHTVGAYRESEHQIVAVDLRCTHLGCPVRWNQAERSWDCPCHGSRFGHDGAVLEGPAVEPLRVHRHSVADERTV